MPSTTVSTQEFATSLSRVPWPASPTQTVREPIASRTGLHAAAHLLRAGGEHHQRTVLGRLLGAEHRARRRTPGRARRRAPPAGRCPRRRRWTAARSTAPGGQPVAGLAERGLDRLDVEEHRDHDVGAAHGVGGGVGDRRRRPRRAARPWRACGSRPAAGCRRRRCCGPCRRPSCRCPAGRRSAGRSSCPSFGRGEVVVVSTRRPAGYPQRRMSSPPPQQRPVPRIPRAPVRRRTGRWRCPGGHPAGRLHVAARRHHRQRRGAVDPAGAGRVVGGDPVDRLRATP